MQSENPIIIKAFVATHHICNLFPRDQKPLLILDPVYFFQFLYILSLQYPQAFGSHIEITGWLPKSHGPLPEKSGRIQLAWLYHSTGCIYLENTGKCNSQAIHGDEAMNDSSILVLEVKGIRWYVKSTINIHKWWRTKDTQLTSFPKFGSWFFPPIHP